MMHEKTDPASRSAGNRMERQDKEDASRERRLSTAVDPYKIYANLAGNPYFRQTQATVGAYPQALTLRISRRREDLVDQIILYASDRDSNQNLILEDHSNTQTFHLLLFLKDKEALKNLLHHPLRGESLFSNTSGTALTPESLLEKADRIGNPG
jgi:hypothetical protein